MFEIYFLTSSRVKFDHISYLLKDYDILVKPQQDYGKAYIEPRIHNREALLKDSIEDANIRLAKALQSKHRENREQSREDIKELAKLYQDKLFIIEDTSVIIDALSQLEETPGVDVKFWMRDIEFADLDKTLREYNNRNVTVRSDIVLYLPPAFRKNNNEHFYKIFTGTSHGSIISKETKFSTNPVYPWLDNKTFNKWFIPEGEEVPISKLPILEANQYDFRFKAIQKLTKYIKEVTGSNLEIPLSENNPFQFNIFRKKNIVICGPTCAGKTILASHLSRKYNFFHIEASDFMYLTYYKKHGFNSSIDIHEYAYLALQENPEIVAQQVITYLEKMKDLPIVITGFRSPKEIPSFIDDFGNFKFYYINSDIHTRYKRSINRNRSDSTQKYSDFKKIDDLQVKMGLSLIKNMDEFSKVENSLSLIRYLKDFEKNNLPNNLHNTSTGRLKVENIGISFLSLEEAILVSLLISSGDMEYKFFSTTQISQLINSLVISNRKVQGKQIITSKNNVSRYFNQKVYPYYEVRLENNVNKFRLSVTGASKATYIINSKSKNTL